ncbi:MAG: OmpA family protein [Flavobacteriaceae bacterium]
MKRLLIIFFVLIGISLPANGQKNTKRADTYFKLRFYTDAIPLYEKHAETRKSKHVVENLAESYYRTFNMPGATKWFGYLTSVHGENLEESQYLKYAHSLKAMDKRNEAYEMLRKYYAEVSDTEKKSKIDQEEEYLKNVEAIGARFDIKNLEINTVLSEFAATEINGNLVYTAAKTSSNGLKKYRWNNQKYLDIYMQPLDKIHLGDSLSVPYSTDINTKLHEGTFALSPDGNTLYFTRNNSFSGRKRTDSASVSNLKIFEAQWVDGKWQNIIELPFNSDDFSNEHPTLSADGKTMVFASDRPGGLGSFDLYTVDILGDGFFTEPKNLGPVINTDKKEQFPFLDQQSNLYFSSDGHPGFGLLDVFIATREGKGYQKPDNIGLPVNSGYDDFSFNVKPGTETGYFSSNRPNGKGSDDIYAFTVTKPLIIEDCAQLIEGTITDKTTKALLPNTQLQLLGANGEVLQTTISDAMAQFKFKVSCTSPYRVEAEKMGYEPNFKSVVTDERRHSSNDASMALMSLKEIEKRKALALKKQKEEAVRLAQIKAAEKREKEIQEKALAEKQHKEKIESTIQKEKDLVREKDRLVIKTEEIHFDYSLWYLRRESRKRLTGLIRILKENPGIILEIGTHTDIRGNAPYNRNLSQKRANSVKTYLMENGIDAHRIIAKGYGESVPIVKCPSEDACSEEDHELNRRCEFVIVHWK